MTKLPCPSPGVHPCDHETYLSWDAVSNTDLGNALRSLQHYHYRRTEPRPPTDSTAFGTAVHAAILEPAVFEARYVREPDPRVIAPSAKSPRSTAAWREAIAVLEATGKTVLDEATWVACERARENAGRSGWVANMLSAAVHREVGLAGPSMYDTINLPTKARPDLLGLEWIGDVKTTRCARPREFARSVVSFGYHRQAAWYLDVAREVGFTGVQQFIIVAVENTPPNEVAVFVLDADAITRGRHDARTALTRIEYAVRSGDYSGYPGEAQVLALPGYAFSQDEED